MSTPNPQGGDRLVIDIGGTHVRIGRIFHSPGVARGGGAGKIANVVSSACVDFETIDDAIAAYLESHPGTVTHMAIAVACPVQGDAISLTNNPWSFSISALKQSLGLERLIVLNDFEAQALAVPQLASDERVQIGTGVGQKNAPIVVVGPGTGLGVAALIPDGTGGWLSSGGEGGHVSWAPLNDMERDVHGVLEEQFGRVSMERLLSGPGIENIYRAVTLIRGAGEPDAFDAAAITERAGVGSNPATDPDCVAAMDLFFAVLGSFCGDLALIHGAFGGVYIGGGIVPRMIDSLNANLFRQRFEAKGRFEGYLAEIPTCVITADEPGLIGAAAALDHMGGRSL